MDKLASLSARAKQNPGVATFRYAGVKVAGAELRSNGRGETGNVWSFITRSGRKPTGRRTLLSENNRQSEAPRIAAVDIAPWPAYGPAPAAGGAAGLLYDLAVGQGLLQFGDAGVGDFVWWR